MVRKSLIYLVQLILLYGSNQEHARLPKYVFNVKSCPCPNNISQWQTASDRLNCLHPMHSKDTGNAYHCLPSSYFNELVEFCGRGITVPSGYCPIYNYTDKADDEPDLYDCTAFISGCPTKSFSSKDVRKFPSCLNINRKHGCFEEESHCPKTSVIPVSTKITNDVKTTTNPELSTTPTYSCSPDIQKPDDNAIYVSIIIIGTCLIIGLTVGLIATLIYLYKYKCLYQEMNMERKEITHAASKDERLNIEYTGGVVSTVKYTNQVNKEELEHLMVDSSTDLRESNECTLEFKDFDNFLQIIGSCITDKTWQSMRTVLLGKFDHECIAKLSICRMLFDLSEIINLRYNVPFLKWIFEECGEHHLVEECHKAEKTVQFEDFQSKCILCNGNEHIEFMLTKTGKESKITDQINNLRNWIGKTIQVHPGQILMTHLNLQTEPIHVTFMMREKTASTLLDQVKTDDGQIYLSNKGVEQIIHDKNVFRIDKALVEGPFIQLRCSAKEKPEENALKNAAVYTLEKVNLPMKGKTVYMSDAKQKRNDNRCESSIQTFIKTNRDSLLDNLEIKTICETDIVELFDKDDVITMKNIKGRRKKAECFFQMCCKLPEETHTKVCSVLAKYISCPKDVPNNEELDRVRNWIQQNQDQLLDEIDSDFIETTFNHMKDVPNDIKKMLQNGSEGRKKKAAKFLEFILKEDEYVRAFQKTNEENGTQFTE